MENNAVYTKMIKMFDFIDSYIISSTKIQEPLNLLKQIKGGERGISEFEKDNETRPYYSFKKSMDTVFDYFKYIYENKRTNEQKYEDSVENLDKKCDCSKYKCKKEDIENESESEESGNESESEELGNESESEEETEESKKNEQEKNPTDKITEKKNGHLLLKKNGIIE